MDLKTAIKVAGSGLNVQSKRIKIIAENIANVDSTGTTPGSEPYRRKTISFKNILDTKTGAEIVTISKTGKDNSPFIKTYNPGHPAANEAGYVLKSNVSTMVEMVDLKEAQRSYEANLSSIEITKTMLNQTLELLR